MGAVTVMLSSFPRASIHVMLAIWHAMDLFIFALNKRRLQIFKSQCFLIVHVIGPNSSTCMGNGEWEPDPREVRCILQTSNVYYPNQVILAMLHIPYNHIY